ncbi:MAG: DUF1801 domain-containing protein [Saprospiraceae bacterium]|nr:DUF1801 domain-containing protein [Saprospiraceae bacterium]
MSAVEDFIYQFEGSQRDVMLHFHDLLTVELNLTEKIRFKIPFYYGKSWICYLNPKKDGKIELAFVRGNELSNYQGILDDKGRKQVCSVEFEKVSEIPIQQMNEIIQEAILLDETTPYESKRKSK